MVESSLKSLIAAVLAETGDQIEENLNSACKRAQAYNGKCYQDMCKYWEEQVQMAETVAQRESNRLLAAARLEHQRRYLHRKGDLVEEVIAAARSELEEICNTRDYPDIMRSLLIEAMLALGRQEVVIKVREQDIDLVKGLLPGVTSMVEAETGVAVQTELTEAGKPILGGVLVCTPDNHMVYNNSFDARLERQLDDLRAEVAVFMFG